VTDLVLPLGDSRLRAAATPVDVRSPSFRDENDRLKAALDSFRREHGFGREIAAPQIGIPSAIVALNLGSGTRSLVNRSSRGAALRPSPSGTTACASRTSS